MSSDQRLYRSVLDQLLTLIDGGEYPAGGRLPPERELAERFGVSRPTIREAIIALEALNRVQVKTGSGVYVLEQPESGNGAHRAVSAFELTEARALIEGEAAALAAKMITEEQLEELATAIEEMADESAGGKLVSEVADKKFHRIISKATRNNMIASVIDNLWYVRDNSPPVRQAYQAICQSDGQARIDEHQLILDALKAHDPTAARAAMHRHFSRILDKLIAVHEAEELENVRRKTLESRQRFSLNHLV